MKTYNRCPWGDTDDLLMQSYHDFQWGKPCHDERELFEMLILEGAQAGLSWSCILHKRENFKEAFDNFDVEKVAYYDESKVLQLMQNSGIIRNRLKIGAAITNAQAVINIGGLDKVIWGYTDGETIINHWKHQGEVPASTALSDKISKNMKKNGFKFVGSTIIYSYLQSIGVINDHLESCDFKQTYVSNILTD